jgi:hypothetical protein
MAEIPKKHAPPPQQTCASWIPYACTKSCGPLANKTILRLKTSMKNARSQSQSQPYSFSNSFSFYNPGKAFLLLLLPDKRRKKFMKALNYNKPYPYKPRLHHLTIYSYYTKSCTVIPNLYTSNTAGSGTKLVNCFLRKPYIRSVHSKA